MAGLEERRHTSGAVSWRVYWRENKIKQEETFATEAQATQFRGLVEASGNRWPYGWARGVGFTNRPAGIPTFSDWAETAIESRPKADPRTKADYRRDLAKHVNPFLGSIPVDQVTTTHVTKWVEQLVAAGLSAKTIMNLHGMASSIMKDALQHRPPLIDFNPFAARLETLPNVRVEEMVFLTPEEFGLVLGFVPDWYRPLATALYGTGLRYGEATALPVSDVTLRGRRRTLTVNRAWKRQPDMSYVLGEPKTKFSRRTLVLSDELVDVILPLVAGKRGDQLVFTSMTGHPLLNSTFHDSAWAPAVAKAMVCDRHRDEQRLPGRKPPRLPKPCDCAGVLEKRPRIHDLRHSHVSLLISDGLPLAAISRRLGHASIQTTVDRYGHLLPDLDNDINAAVDRALSHR